MKINERLKKVSEYIPDTSSILDVGCDHALLDIYIVKNKKNIKCVASDINEGPLKQASKNIKSYNLEKFIEIRLGNGLETIDENIDTVVISGMGSITIIDIIKNGLEKLNNVKRLILSPNNDFYELRKEIIKLGFVIEKEDYIEENNKYYLIISFVKGKKKYSNMELLYGTNYDNKEYFINTLNKEKTKLKNIPKKYILKRLKIYKKIRLLNKII